MKIGNLIIITIGTRANEKFIDNMIVATIDESIIPKKVKNGLTFISFPSTAVVDSLSSPSLTLSAIIEPQNKNIIKFTGVGPNLNTNFSGYCTLIYDV